MWFKNVSVLKNIYSFIKAMCQRWPAICSQFAMQSRSYYDCYEFEAKVRVKKTMEKTSFFVHADGCNIRVRRGFAQIWCSDPFEPMVISGLSSNFGPVPPFPVLRFAFFILRFLFSVLRSLFLVPRFSLPALRSLLE